MPILDKYVDVDFPADPNYVLGDITESRFGTSKEFGSPIFEDAIKTISEAEFREAVKATDAMGGGLDLMTTRIYDQRSTPSCTSNAAAAATEKIEYIQGGPEAVVHKSAMSLYYRVGSPRSGSSVDSNLRELRNRGILPLDTPANREKYDHVMHNADRYEAPPRGWEKTGALFRALEWFDIRTPEGFKTAIALGYPVVYGRAGHAILGVRFLFENGRLLLKYQNSWHERWGDKGFGYDSEKMMVRGSYYAFALRSFTVQE